MCWAVRRREGVRGQQRGSTVWWIRNDESILQRPGKSTLSYCCCCAIIPLATRSLPLRSNNKINRIFFSLLPWNNTSQHLKASCSREQQTDEMKGIHYFKAKGHLISILDHMRHSGESSSYAPASLNSMSLFTSRRSAYSARNRKACEWKHLYIEARWGSAGAVFSFHPYSICTLLNAGRRCFFKEEKRWAK